VCNLNGCRHRVKAVKAVACDARLHHERLEEDERVVVHLADGRIPDRALRQGYSHPVTTVADGTAMTARPTLQ